MIDHIGDSALRVATKIDSGGAIHDRMVSQQKAREILDARPVEQARAGDQTEKKDAEKDEETSRYLLDERRIVFEKYDENGDVILRIPPSQTPVDTVA
jgi:hypothetical protein